MKAATTTAVEAAATAMASAATLGVGGSSTDRYGKSGGSEQTTYISHITEMATLDHRGNSRPRASAPASGQAVTGR